MIYKDIQRAVDTGAIIEISYKKSDGTASVRRLSDVHYSIEFDGKEYITAFCHKRNERRTFKISRINKVEFISSPNALTESSNDTNPESVDVNYEFDGEKGVFSLYGFDYNA